MTTLVVPHPEWSHGLARCHNRPLTAGSAHRVSGLARVSSSREPLDFWAAAQIRRGYGLD